MHSGQTLRPWLDCSDSPITCRQIGHLYLTTMLLCSLSKSGSEGGSQLLALLKFISLNESERTQMDDLSFSKLSIMEHLLSEQTVGPDDRDCAREQVLHRYEYVRLFVESVACQPSFLERAFGECPRFGLISRCCLFCRNRKYLFE